MAADLGKNTAVFKSGFFFALSSTANNNTIFLIFFFFKEIGIYVDSENCLALWRTKVTYQAILTKKNKKQFKNVKLQSLVMLSEATIGQIFQLCSRVLYMRSYKITKGEKSPHVK